MMRITVEEAIKERIKAEIVISDALNALTAKTGLGATDIEVERHDRVDHDGEHKRVWYLVHITAEV